MRPTATRHARLALTTALLLGFALPAAAQPSFVTFESGHVRPLALTPDGSKLLAVNTPDNRLEIFDVTAGGLLHVDSVPVGMEPVAVAARSNTEIWVVNHLSDSISIVDLAATPPQVTRTLLVGDEPRDIVFAGTFGNRAFITTAHRGQHRTHSSISGVTGAGDPQLTTEGIGRADVWVFDANNLGTTIGGTPLRILTFFADTPRALARSADGNTVYVAAFHSGNQTTAINETSVCDGFTSAGSCNAGGATAPGGLPGPDDNADGDPAPETGLIVKFNPGAGQWRDVLGRNWSNHVRFSLPDRDVFSINANTFGSGTIVNYTGVGTILFNMAVNPVTGKVYVSNTESPNLTRFEGAGEHGGSTVQGHLSETRISVLTPGTGAVDPQHLNQHIDYSKLHTDVPDLVDPTQKNHSLATPLQMVVSGNGSTVYLAAFGSAKIGVFSASALEDAAFETNFDPTAASASYIPTGGGPSGLALDETNGRLYVMTRFDNSVVSIDLGDNSTLQTLALHNPEPTHVVEGRPFLYDAVETSGNGEASCASCHIFGDLDSLAWDLGDPDAPTTSNTQPSATPILPVETTFHPMKGPMTTQTLRGLNTHGGMHWRGDRVDGFFGTDPCTITLGAPCDEEFSFNNFIVAFEGLVGRDGILSTSDMQKFTDFALALRLPPNPVRALNNSLTTAQNNGRNTYMNTTSDVVATCNGCHPLAPLFGFFGSGGKQTFEGETQNFKVAHLRNAYAKVGMFGLSTGGGNTGEQVRGFGFLHDGSVDTVNNFLSANVFNLTATEQLNLQQFVLAFDSDLAPIVGQQITLTATNGTVANPRIDLLIQRAATSFDSLVLGGTVTECDVVVKGSQGGIERGWVRQSDGLFRSDINTTLTDATLRGLAVSEGPLTYTCAPPGSGTRMGIDRDLDVALDGLDNCPSASNPTQLDTDGDLAGNACDEDDDGDGLLDVVETNTGTYVSPSNTGTNPLVTDTDVDGFDDDVEIAAGSDPTDFFSTPNGAPTSLPALGGFGLSLLGLALAGIGFAASRSARR